MHFQHWGLLTGHAKHLFYIRIAVKQAGRIDHAVVLVLEKKTLGEWIDLDHDLGVLILWTGEGYLSDCAVLKASKERVLLVRVLEFSNRMASQRLLKVEWDKDEPGLRVER